MSGKNSYASQTIYNIMEGNDNTDKNTVITITQTAATTAAGTMVIAAGMSGIISNAYGLMIKQQLDYLFFVWL
jgi:hypothetical protein